MFKKLLKIAGGLAIVNTTYLFCNPKKGVDDKIPHYHFLNESELNKLLKKYQNLSIIERSQTEHILSVIRNVDTNIVEFRRNADRLIRILIEKALSQIEKKKQIKQSPLGYYDSHEIPFKDEDLCFVSILRSGNAFLLEAIKVIAGASVGQILIQRQEDTSLPMYYFQKLPTNVHEQQVILVDPMLATGGSADLAIKILKSHGVKEENITLLTLVSCDTGLQKLFSTYPKMKIITAQVDPILLKDINFLAPGIGDFGDRYFGTVSSKK